MRIKKLTTTATIPSRGSVKAAGFDLYADEDVGIEPFGRTLVSTGIAVEIPTGCYGRIAPRSGLAVKQGLDVLAGVVDEDYRGEVKALLYNTTKDTVIELDAGERIAQLIIEKYYAPVIEVVDNLDDTERAEDGFGSTGR